MEPLSHSLSWLLASNSEGLPSWQARAECPALRAREKRKLKPRGVTDLLVGGQERGVRAATRGVALELPTV